MEKLNKAICEYIAKEWIGNISNRRFALSHNIDEKTVRKIKEINNVDYSITIDTLERICTSREIKLKDFFALINW